MNQHSRHLSPDVVWRVLLILFVVGSTTLGRSFTAIHPDEFDAQIFAIIGDQWRHGLIPYVDVWDNKPPGIFVLVAVIFSLFPKSFTALAFAEGIFVIGCIGTVYGIMRSLRAPAGAVLLSTVAAAIATNLLYFNQRGVFTEIFLLWPAALSMLFFVKASQASLLGKWIFLAGVCSGVAALFKPTGLSPFLAQTAFIAFLATTNRCSLRTAALSIVISIGGIFVAWLPALIYFGLNGGLYEMINAFLLYNIDYGVESQRSIFETISTTISSISPIFQMLIFVIFIGAIIIFSKKGRKHTDSIVGSYLLFSLWVFFDLAGALAGGRGYHHYFLPLACSLSVAVGFAYWFLQDREAPSDRPGGILRACVVLILVVPLVYHQGSDLHRMVLLLREGPPRPYWDTTAKTLNAIRQPGDTLFTWNYWPGFYVATDMRSPSRFLSAHYLKDSPQANEVIGNEILYDLVRKKPSFIIEDADSDDDLLYRNNHYKNFKKMLIENYKLIFQDSLFHLYRLRSDTDRSSDETGGKEESFDS